MSRNKQEVQNEDATRIQIQEGWGVAQGQETGPTSGGGCSKGTPKYRVWVSFALGQPWGAGTPNLAGELP